MSCLSAVEAKPNNESESDDESNDESNDESDDVSNGNADNNETSHCNQNVNNSGHMHLSPRNAPIMDRSIYNTTSNVDISTYNNRLMLRNAPVQSPLNIQNNTCMSGIITLQQQQLMNLQQPQLLNLQQPQVLNLQQQQHLNLQQPQQYPMLLQNRMMMELNTVSMPKPPVHNTMTVTKKKRKKRNN